MPEAQPLLPHDPRRVGSYELTARLGSGTQGTVFLGSGPCGERVAVKLLRVQFDEDGSARARFIREAAVAKQVARFCTAQILDADTFGDAPYLVSEYVPGPALSTQVDRSGPLRAGALERLAVSTASALAAIHRAGIIHRDLKPPNVLLGPDGPRVIDFGLSRALDAVSAVSGTAIGTPAYMSPEQINSDEVGPAADVFAWGSIMTFAATGHPPFGDDSIPAVIYRILHEEPHLGELEELDGELRELVAAALSKDPAARPTAAQLLLRLVGHDDAYRPGPLTTLPGGASSRPSQTLPGSAALTTHPTGGSHDARPAASRDRRRMVVTATVAAVTAGFVGAGAGAVWAWPSDSQQGDGGEGGSAAIAEGGTQSGANGLVPKYKKRDSEQLAKPPPGQQAASGSSRAPSRGRDKNGPGPGDSGSPSAKPSPSLVRLGSPDPNGYCAAGGKFKADYRSGTWYCVPDGGIGVETPITMTQVCRSQYRPAAEAKLKGSASRPGDWECYLIQ
ncbi:serine/threonine protein kinase [Actinomadura barringtoniae]|uniref:Serine/threonine protein kinase n=1 Tax=Actinomadura barringtoniae TaxID=1427535 RepID=A0A939T4V6_9ACTN|nr:serine/threonine-protein kinase [Actinomadura barringtoniae]MBO2449873.1 serine/threonine protein kinase [Actinomadura barringtoniae]